MNVMRLRRGPSGALSTHVASWGQYTAYMASDGVERTMYIPDRKVGSELPSLERWSSRALKLMVGTSVKLQCRANSRVVVDDFQ